MIKRKKYLFLIPNLGGGGAERVLVTLANGLCDKADVRIVTLTSAKSFYALDNRVCITNLHCAVNRQNRMTLLWSKFFGAIRALRGLKKILATWEPDTLLSFLQDTNALTIILKIFGGIKCKVVVSERADPNKRSKIEMWFERRFYCKADIIICQSEKVAHFFPENVQNKIKIIRNPICANAIPQLFTGNRRKVIVGIGRLFPQKNFELLINAFAHMGADFSEYTLEIYGSGCLEGKLEKQISEMELSKRVHLMGLKKNVMFSIYDASLFVLTSDFEGFPNALIEAMATGLPVVTTDFSPGIARELVYPSNGIVVPVNDEKALILAMRDILFDIEKQKKMSIENRKILSTLSEEKIIPQWEEWL